MGYTHYWRRNPELNIKAFAHRSFDMLKGTRALMAAIETGQPQPTNAKQARELAKHTPGPLISCSYWWTYQGYKGAKAFALAHTSQASADFHHGMATSLGGAFDCAGRTTRPITEAEMRAGLANRFPAGVEIVNPARAEGGAE